MPGVQATHPCAGVRIGKIKPPVCFWHHPECFLPPTTLLAATDLGAIDALEQADRDLVQGRLDSVAAEREARRLGVNESRKRRHPSSE